MVTTTRGDAAAGVDMSNPNPAKKMKNPARRPESRDMMHLLGAALFRTIFCYSYRIQYYVILLQKQA
jgi:hypothetical protein